MSNADSGKITVITVALDAASALEKTIESIVALQNSNLDYIIVDGASDDGTQTVIRKYEKYLKRWVSEPDRGVYDAMNKGWAMADMGSRILYIGAGDSLISLPSKNELISAGSDVIFGNVQLDNGKFFKSQVGIWLKLYNSLHHQGLLIPKFLHPTPPFDLHYPHYADFDFNQRLLKQGATFRFSSALCTYASPAGLTGQTQVSELAQIINKNFGLIWCIISKCSYSLSQVLPVMERFKPVR